MIKRHLLVSIFLVLQLTGIIVTVLTVPTVHADHQSCTDGTPIPDPIIGDGITAFCEPHGGVSSGSPTPSQLEADCETLDDCGIIRYIRLAINVLSGLVGVIVVIMIVLGGIQYTTSRDNAQAVAQARERILNAITALVIYLGVTAFLQWIIPGGIFSG